jgi:hypothetical protein
MSENCHESKNVKKGTLLSGTSTNLQCYIAPVIDEEYFLFVSILNASISGRNEKKEYIS